MRKAVWKIVKNIEKKEDFDAPLGIDEPLTEKWYNWYKPKNAEELQALNTFYNDGYINCDGCIIDMFSEDAIGKWVCIEADRCEEDVLKSGAGFGYGYTLDDFINYARNFFAEFGLPMTLTETGEE